MNDESAAPQGGSQNHPPLYPGVGLWGRGYLLRMIENLLLPHQEELGTSPGGWGWLSPSLLPPSERLLPSEFTISPDHHFVTLKAAPSIGFIDVGVVKPAGAYYYEKAVFLVHSVAEGNALHLVITTQLNQRPSRQHNQTYLVCVHAKDEEVVLGSTSKDLDMHSLRLIAMTLANHCPDIPLIFPRIDLKLTQTSIEATIDALNQRDTLTAVTNQQLAEFRATLGA